MTLDDLYTRAKQYAEAGDIANTITTLHQALLLAPKDATLHHNLATAYQKNHETNKARTHYQEALKLNPHYVEAHHNLAILCATTNDFHQALHHYKLAIHQAPDFAAAHYHLGLLLLKHHEFTAAATQFKNVLALNPQHKEACFYHGVLLLESGALDDAQQAFQTVLQLDDEHVEAWVNLGVIALKKEQAQQAVAHFTQALALDNTHVEARNNLAATFMHHDRFENALMHYDVLLQQAPHQPEFLYNTGVAQMALGHLQEAIQFFKTLLSLQPTHVAALTNLAAIHIRLQERTKAIDLLKEALRIQPQDEISQFMLHALTQDELQIKACLPYVSNLFNRYALYYEEHLKGALGYTLPYHIEGLLQQLQLPLVKTAIDLGCGTGLCGPVLRPYCEQLVGVDIAAKMLAQAERKQCYDKLIEAELMAFLQQDAHLYNLALAADVIPYLGELEALFSGLAKRLATQGLFILSHEISEDRPWQLQENARFSHHPNYIKDLCQHHGFNILHQEKAIARQQDNQAVFVMLYALQR